MSAVVLLTDEELDSRAIRVLVRELGPVESARFLNILTPPAPGTDAVEIHRAWLESIDEDAWVQEMLSKMNVDPRLESPE